MGLEQVCFHHDSFSEGVYLDLLRSSSGEVYLGWSMDRPVASLALRFEKPDKICHVLSLAVLPECRKQGFGRALMLFAEDEARLRKCTFMYLEVRLVNQPARRLYRQLGYAGAGLLHDYYGPGAHGKVYLKKLAGAGKP